jgi:hypothetical protein
VRVTAIETFSTWGDPRIWIFVKVQTDEQVIAARPARRFGGPLDARGADGSVADV